MEPITHFLTGACLGRAGFNRKTAYATLAMTLAAEAPDLDILWSLRGPVAGFAHHRGITHAFVGAPFIALTVTGAIWLFDRLRRKRPRPRTRTGPRWWLLWCFALVAALSHLLLDYTNNYGLRPFFPFNPRWYSGDIVFIFDPLLFLMLLFGLIVPGILGWVDREISNRRRIFPGRGWAAAALVGVACLYGVRITEHARALRLMQQTSFGDEATVRAAAEPYPINPFHWQAIAETASYYQFGDVRTLQDSVQTDNTTDRIAKPPVSAAVAAAKQSWLGRVYLSWSQFPLVEDAGRGTPPGTESDAASSDPAAGALDAGALEQVDFHDMRFGYSGWISEHTQTKPLSGSVYVAPNGQIEATYMDGKLQP